MNSTQSDSPNFSQEDIVEFPGEPRSVSNIGGEAHEPDSAEKGTNNVLIEKTNNSMRISFDFVLFLFTIFVFIFF